MPVSTTSRGQPNGSSAPYSSPTRSTASQLEVTYNTAVQSFVRRDHPRTHSALSRLLKLLDDEPAPTVPWFEYDGPVLAAAEKQAEEWRNKILKLLISAFVSLYSDPPAQFDGLDSSTRTLLPPYTQPDALLAHLLHTCEKQALPGTALPKLLPPAIVSTLLLASIKLQPAPPALDFAHRLAEDWLAGIPDRVLLVISTGNGHAGAGKVPHHAHAPEIKKRIEGIREGYIKVVELFVGEVLVKEGEWDMARSFLEGEGVMASKRKENLYKHIRTAQSRPRSAPSSPSSSLVLPTSSGVPIISHSGTSSRTRSRASSASSSSSEATARPNTSDRLGVARPARRSARGRDHRGISTTASATAPAGIGRRDKGKGRAAEEVEADDEKDADAAISVSTRSSLPSRLFINHSPDSSTRGVSQPRQSRPTGEMSRRSSNTMSWDALLDLLPKNAQDRLRPILANPWLLAAISIPVPLAILVTFVMFLRRRLMRRATAGTTNPAALGAVVGGSTVAVDALSEVRERLRRARETGAREWMRAWLAWWLRKFAGVWKMATTITYL